MQAHVPMNTLDVPQSAGTGVRAHAYMHTGGNACGNTEKYPQPSGGVSCWRATGAAGSLLQRELFAFTEDGQQSLASSFLLLSDPFS